MFDYNKIKNAFESFKFGQPFDHCVVDNFLDEEITKELEKEFIPYDSDSWVYYKNPIENKKALGEWNKFGKYTYNYFEKINSPEFVGFLSELVGVKLYPDYGLHGGGWHCHGQGGNLNPHLDYSIHPKLGLQRKLNIIFYVSSSLEDKHGGHLGLWTHDEKINGPKDLYKELTPLFNRAVFFDTTQNSWHGMSRQLDVPDGVYRKSLAVYYLCDPEGNVDPRNRALFAPREEQKGDKYVEEVIKSRSHY